MGPLELMAAGCVLIAFSAVCLAAVPPKARRDIDAHLDDDGLSEYDDDYPAFKGWR